MKNIHLLSANSPVQTLGIGFELVINNYIFLNGIMQNIHITNNDEIKDGDWIYRRKDGYETIQKATFPLNLTSINKKIILTTDSKLIADGVQAIPVDFLEWFVKNPSCEEVEVKKWFDYESIPNTTYEIITPKEEPKYSVKKEYVDDQDAYGYDVIVKEKSKKETLSNPIIIVRNDDKEEFIHLSNGMYRTKWGILNNSVSTIPLEAFDKSKFTFYYE